MFLFRKKEYFKQYGLDLLYEFETYKHVGHDYGNRKTANLGWVLNFKRWKRKRRNQKKNEYQRCDTYSEWKRHVEEILTVGVRDYDNMLHYLYEKKNAAEKGIEGVKSILIPLYVAIIALISTMTELNVFGTIGKILFYLMVIVLIIGVSVPALHDAYKEIEFYRDFIEIAKEKGARHMSSQYSRYDYRTCDEVKKHLGRDFQRMVFSIEEYGCVCQDQYEGLTDYLCESCVNLIVDALREETDKPVRYTYSATSRAYVFFDTDRMNDETAMIQVDKVQLALRE